MAGQDALKQVNKVLRYIEHHLNEPLSLEMLAKISTYSAYHFQRTFKAIVGETPAAYMKRLRLENAAHLLIYEPDIPVTEVALMSGFSSLSYFTYSFQAYFRTSPSKWREGAYLERFPREYASQDNRKKSKQLRKNEQEDGSPRGYNEFRWLDLNRVNIMEMPACQAISRTKIGPYTAGIPQAWEDLYHWCTSRDFIKQDTFMFGIPRSNPYITPPEKSRYDCRVEISEEALRHMDQDDIVWFQGGKHVVYVFEDKVDYRERSRLIECYSELYSYWLPKSGYRYLSNPIEWIELQQVEGSLSTRCLIKAIGLAIEPK
ncbi:AraC family transcriptional regulator [Marinicrinis sediminis]|uniref:GyrI-like domain-containing protein n=1 Tax=Marinicrinis sediminis TaxID=1652465 RepID=A0ABW5RA68_9BACL